jgi:hypothetical protein
MRPMSLATSLRPGSATMGERSFVAGGRVLRTTPAFDSYWTLAAERQRMFFRRVRREVPPWTEDPVLASNRFTNAYRASDRVSQFLINRVIYGVDPTSEPSQIFRVLLFKIFNRIDTWEYLESEVGPISAETFDFDAYRAALDVRFAGKSLYSGAYIMPCPKLGEATKHANHLRLLAALLADGTIDRIGESCSLRQLYDQLLAVPSFGPFLAFQYAVDLNYSDLFAFSEMDHVVAGPGSLDGIAKCFLDTDGLGPEDVIRAVADTASQSFLSRDISFDSLWGRPLQLIDCQNLFCELSKYARVAHPELPGLSGRTQIKQRYSPRDLEMRVGYPPRWAHEYTGTIPVAVRQSPVR